MEASEGFTIQPQERNFPCCRFAAGIGWHAAGLKRIGKDAGQRLLQRSPHLEPERPDPLLLEHMIFTNRTKFCQLRLESSDSPSLRNVNVWIG